MGEQGVKRRLLTVRVQPRAFRQQLEKISENEFRARLTSAPEKGKANAELLELLADYLGVPVSSLRLVRGETARVKVVELTELQK
ncbi:MAG: DUF167 domain-containing protein [Candidatus Aminicenantes bacterium]|nr:DUF167 domain-containing protein [Candidatus Aminicenantes bacterium]